MDKGFYPKGQLYPKPPNGYSYTPIQHDIFICKMANGVPSIVLQKAGTTSPVKYVNMDDGITSMYAMEEGNKYRLLIEPRNPRVVAYIYLSSEFQAWMYDTGVTMQKLPIQLTLDSGMNTSTFQYLYIAQSKTMKVWPDTGFTTAVLQYNTAIPETIKYWSSPVGTQYTGYGYEVRILNEIPWYTPAFIATMKPTPPAPPPNQSEPAPLAQPAIQPTIQSALTPVVTPVIQPAVKPIVTPAVKPIVTPAVKPIVIPIAQPASQAKDSMNYMLFFIFLFIVIIAVFVALRTYFSYRIVEK